MSADNNFITILGLDKSACMVYSREITRGMKLSESGKFWRGMSEVWTGKIRGKLERYETPKFGESLTTITMLCILVIIPAGQGK